MEHHPTCVIGVGGAGIEVMNTLAGVVEQTEHRDRFRFIAMDSDSRTLNQKPGGAFGIRLDHDPDFVLEDKGKYPYLTEVLVDDLVDEGAMRQRPIGRYKLDSRGAGKNSFERVYESLWTEIEAHYDDWTLNIRSDQASFNIFYIHSMGGGTGSGVFPLLTAMLGEVRDQLTRSMNNVEIYLGGVGIVPKITFDPDIVEPHGDPRCYPNTYAAMCDLDNLEQLESLEESRTLTSYAMTHGNANMDNAPGKAEFELNSPPFDDYWLFGVEEDKLGGSTSSLGGENYAERVDQTIARSLHAISHLGRSAEHWDLSTPPVGSFDQAEVRVPHREVRTYYDTQAKRDETQRRKDEEIPDEIADLQTRRGDLEALKDDLAERAVGDSERRETVRARIDTEFPSGKQIVENRTVDDIERVLDDIENDHGLEGTAIATTIIQDKLDEKHGLPRVEADRKDIINDLWSEYNMSAVAEQREVDVNPIEAKPTILQRFLQDKIGEYTDILENWDPGLVGQIQDTLPPVGPFESDREHAEKVLEKLEKSRQELDRVESEWGRVSDMRQAVSDRRREVRERIDDRMHDIEDQITDLQIEREELERDLQRLDDDLDSIRSSLAAEQTGQRLFVLPIETENLDDIDPENADEILDSLSKYVDKGLVREDLFSNTVSKCIDYCNAESRRDVIQQDMDFDQHRPPQYDARTETWLLFHEDNEAFKDDINVQIGPSSISQEHGQLDYLSDPYRIEFVSFSRRGPVPSFEFYQQLEDMAEEGYLDSYAEQYRGDHRKAFAYIEWYGREIRGPVLDDREVIELEKPPEMDLESVEKPDFSEGKVKSWVRANGLDEYVWNGAMMDDYDDSEDNTFTGWRDKLSSNAVSWQDMMKATPSVNLKKQWLAGNAEWEEIIDAYADNLREETGGLDVRLVADRKD